MMDPQPIQPTQQPAQPPTQPQPQIPVGPEKSKSKWIFVILLLVIIAGIAIYFLQFNKKNKEVTTELSSPQPTSISFPTSTIVPYNASLVISPNPLTISKSQATQKGSVDLILNTTDQETTAVQIEISYDPLILTGVDITPGTFFNNPTVLLKKIDQSQGKISFALSAPLTEKGKQGIGTVATISFTASTQKSKSTQISFLPKTLVAAQEAQISILKTITGTSILFQ